MPLAKSIYGCYSKHTEIKKKKSSTVLSSKENKRTALLKRNPCRHKILTRGLLFNPLVSTHLNKMVLVKHLTVVANLFAAKKEQNESFFREKGRKKTKRNT
ncbi:hypothetical protein CEXT_234721 [Caerostris extrusa]|uniref:Uncharacterized protein n=1 Tax=Caerostris extrusa TaxID=172846 RepID=A0AAV4WBZ7_CAEEX|nr:hypothetical protein CEXT_234721 [Caerostris extrusa]